MATFTVVKGGLMYEASIGGQKFNYEEVIHLSLAMLIGGAWAADRL
jgi:hypothetical protein